MADFGKAFKKAGFGWDRKYQGGGNDFHGGGKPDFQKGKAPMMGQDDDEQKKFAPPGGDDEGGDEDKGEMKPETPKEEGAETETIEAVLELFDQLTPLIEKLRNK